MYGRSRSLEPGENLVHRGREKEETTCMTTSCMQNGKKKQPLGYWSKPERMPNSFWAYSAQIKGPAMLGLFEQQLGSAVGGSSSLVGWARVDEKERASLLECPFGPRFWALGPIKKTKKTVYKNNKYITIYKREIVITK